ncbi:MAG: hypothetical protein M3301_07270 [Chloroflexota bacterium]|nr:hypothetical protein [Chloroflexota bacterium]
MTPLAVALSGLAAGVVGAMLLAPLVYLSRLAVGYSGAARRSSPLGPGEILSEAERVPPDLLQVTAVFVQKVATGLFGESLSLRQQRFYGGLWHLAYGGFWGVGYALIQSSTALPAVILGPAYGLVVWAVGPAWLVPRMRLMLPLGRQATHITVHVVAWHALYGSTVAAAIDLARG